MQDILTANEALIQTGVFVLVFSIFALMEALAPRRVRVYARGFRWANNLGIAILGTVLVRLVFPAALVGFALLVQARGWGVLPLLGLPPVTSEIAAFVLLDAAIYAQHVAFHKVPLFWRLHRMHHADLDVDVTTGIRFHPGELLLSTLVKITAIAAIGASPFAVLAFETALVTASMFAHSNLRIPFRFDVTLRRILVTPDMHRVHHSSLREETDSNYGTILPYWDWMFRTYRPQPALGHDGMEIGLRDFRREEDSRMDRLVLQPFIGRRRQS